MISVMSNAEERINSGQAETCPVCGLPRSSSSSGRITQYISVCNCLKTKSIRSAAAGAVGINIVDVCASCGKRIGQGRRGSLTQFIFRSELCGCSVPRPLRKEAQQEYFSEVFEGFKVEAELEDAPVLELDEESFPLERYIPYLVLGRGASGTVYLAKDRVLKKRVAVKVLNSVDDRQAIDFQNEARATSVLDHPNIIKIFDFGCTEGGAPYMVLGYKPSVSLDVYLKEKGKLPYHQALPVFIQLCQALSYAHENEIFHRDLKPSNILLTGESIADARVKLIDFGVARTKQVNQEPTIVQGKTIAGTPAYMSPDQVHGGAYDRRSEIYSLGCVIFEALSGKPPFVGEESLEILRQHAEDDPPELDVDGPVPKELSALLRQCLAKDPDLRFQSMEELEEALLSVPLSLAGSGTNFEQVYGDSEASVFYGVAAVLSLAAFFLGCAFWYLMVHQPQSSGGIAEANVKSRPVKFVYGRAKIDSKVAVRPKPVSGTITDASLAVVARDLNRMINSSPRDAMVLRRLSLAGAQIDGSGLKYLAKVPLTTLNLEHSTVKGDNLAYLVNMPLQELFLGRVKFTNKDLDNVYAIGALNKLDLNTCPGVDDDSFGNLTRLRSIQKIKVGGTAISDRAVEQIVLCKSLRALDLEGTAITGRAIDAICTLPRVEEINVAGCKNIGFDSVNRLTRKFPDIRSLNIGYLNLTGGQVGVLLEGCTSLTGLNLFGIPVNDGDLKILKYNKNLKSLTLSNATISDATLTLLYDKSNLKELLIHNCPNLTSKGLKKLQMRNPNIKLLVANTPNSTGIQQKMESFSEFFGAE